MVDASQPTRYKPEEAGPRPSALRQQRDPFLRLGCRKAPWRLRHLSWTGKTHVVSTGKEVTQEHDAESPRVSNVQEGFMEASRECGEEQGWLLKTIKICPAFEFPENT